MPGLLSNVDPDGLLEYSVVYTDRALNHMSARFGDVMRDILRMLKTAYVARSAVVVPGSGTFGMEAVARQFATGRKVLVLRNGWFSYRWSQIFDAGKITSEQLVLKASAVSSSPQAAYLPAPVDAVVETILRERPGLVFAPHVETSSGLILDRSYLRSVADAAREVGALFVLDCIASGAMWVDMERDGVDVLISAPQKGWSGSPCCAFVMLGERARRQIDSTTSSSFAIDLKKWLQIAELYEAGGHAYHATLPTDALVRTHASMRETVDIGLDVLQKRQVELGARVRACLAERGIQSVAGLGFEAPSVVVSHTVDDAVQSGAVFRNLGLQTAAGVPLQCGEPADFKTFRIGLFGLEKLQNLDRSVATLQDALGAVFPPQ
jgi:aspartate aminotransferase-like enzyme